MRSPLHAMLWEIWRVTRVEVAWRLALGIVGALAVLAVFSSQRGAVKDFSAAIALILIVMPHFLGWMSMAKLNGGRPGFPLYLLYPRPIRTAVLVGLPMVYLTAASAAIYLVSALLLRGTSGYPFPLLPVAAWIVALNLVYAAMNWSTRNRVIQMLGMMAASAVWVTLADHRLNAEEIQGNYDWPPNLWPTRFDFPLTDYALIGAIGLASFGVAVARVAWQRHGGAPSALPRTVGSARFPEWLAHRFPCPTSSATRAQLWFELRSSGLPVLVIGLAIASLTPLVFAVTAPAVSLRPFAVTWTVLSVLAALFVGTNSGFGIRVKQGRLDRSEFDATLAAGSAWLAGLKVIVRSVCALAVLIALGVSVWGSLSFIAVGKGYEPLRSLQRASEGAVGALAGYQLVALAAVAFIGFVAMGALHAAIWAIWTRYFRRMNIAASLLLLYGLSLALLTLAVRSGIASEFPLDILFGATRWTAAAAMVFTTIYLFWNGLAERLLTFRYVCSALLASAAFGAAWVTTLRATGVQLAGMPAANAVSMLSPVLLPLMASVLAPWSLNRIRHT